MVRLHGVMIVSICESGRDLCIFKRMVSVAAAGPSSEDRVAFRIYPSMSNMVDLYHGWYEPDM